MKIGIITFWQSNDNYGQVLQCFALQQQLIKLGHKPFLIKYVPLQKIIRTSIAGKLWKIVQIYPIFLRLRKMQKAKQAKAFALKNRQRRFDEFRENHIVTNGAIYHGLSDIQNNPPEADCYLCGSDQVWSMLLDNDENQAFYLNFGDKDTKRIAYAASFGRDVYPMELNGKLHDMLVKFNAVSVREKSGIGICKKVGIQAVDVLDPTLLLSMKEYVRIIEKPFVNEKYFYTYSLNITSEKDLCWKALLDYANQYGFKSISTTSSGYFIGKEICLNTEYVYATIPQWLGYIQNAEFVATTSFHGIAFCLIMHTNFVYFPLKGIHSRGNSRVVSLLDSLGLHEKIFRDAMTIKQCIEHPIDWNKVEAKLNVKKNASISFLENSLH